MNSDERYWSHPNSRDDQRNRNSFYKERSEYNRYENDPIRPWDDQRQTGRYSDSRDHRYANDERFSQNNRRYNDPNQWARYDENRRDFERHPEHYSESNRAPMRYNERPWPLDRFAEKLERSWNRWVNRDYSHHTPDSDFSW